MNKIIISNFESDDIISSFYGVECWGAGGAVGVDD